MGERDRQRRLHVTNRLEELNARHGAVDAPLPPWLDTYEGFLAAHEPAPEPENLHTTQQAAQAPPPPRPTPASAQRVWERS